MHLFLHLVWLLIVFLRYAGVVAIFAGVALFGVYFIAGNARSIDSSVPLSSWQGRGPIKGMKIVVVGVLMLLASHFISLFMPNGS